MLLNQRSLEIFRYIVEEFVATGEPIGSQTLSQKLGMRLSSATIRNVMARLEEAGLLYAPYTSSGRLPTNEGLKFFVHTLMEVGDLDAIEQKNIEKRCKDRGLSMENLLEEASSTLSGLSRCAGLVIAPKYEQCLKHIEFIPIEPGKALVVLVTYDSHVENRIIEINKTVTPSDLREASNYLNTYLVGATLREVHSLLNNDLEKHRYQLSQAAKTLVEEGIAQWVEKDQDFALIVTGQNHLLENVMHQKDLERVKEIFSLLDSKEVFRDLVESTITGDGVQIFIGAENQLFNLIGCSLLLAPYKNKKGKIFGTVGVIGPTRLNYARIVPMVDYTARVISRILG